MPEDLEKNTESFEDWIKRAFQNHQNELPFHRSELHCPCPACGQQFYQLGEHYEGAVLTMIDTVPNPQQHIIHYFASPAMAVETADEDVVKTMVDGWDERKQALVYKYLYLTGMRIDKAESLLRKKK